MSDRCNAKDYGARPGEKMGHHAHSELHPNEMYILDDMEWPELRNLTNRTFDWEKLVDRMFDQHQVIRACAGMSPFQSKTRPKTSPD